MKNVTSYSHQINSNRHTRRALNRPAAQKTRKRVAIKLYASFLKESQPLSAKVIRAQRGRWGGRLRTRSTHTHT